MGCLLAGERFSNNSQQKRLSVPVKIELPVFSEKKNDSFTCEVKRSLNPFAHNQLVESATN